MKGPLATLAALAALACTYCIGALAADSVAAPSKLAAGDVLNRPAMMSPLASKRLLVSMTRFGDRLVAVGPRGHIVVSTDEGKTWSQAKVPVSSDLTAVYFPSATHGWAVGHDGVVLASTDGGTSWIKQLDGFAVNDLIIADLKAKVAANADINQFSLPCLPRPSATRNRAPTSHFSTSGSRTSSTASSSVPTT